jgi:polysaccharide biosynthesis protein PslH
VGTAPRRDCCGSTTMTELLVTSATPTLSNGRGIRTYGVTAALARHRPVELVHIVFEGRRPAQQYLSLPGVTIHALEPSRGAGRGTEYAKARLRGVPSRVARGVSHELVHAADDAPESVRVIADGPTVAAALLPLARRRPIVYLAHNFESSFRNLGRGNLAAFERAVFRTFEEVWLPTQADVQGAIELAGESVAARHVPNVVDTRTIKPVSTLGRQRVLMVGDFTYPPNREGLEFLTKAVLPIARESRPQLQLVVAGRGLPTDHVHDRTQVLGYVDDLLPVYASVDIAAVPLLRGGGSPLKFAEALAYGLPVVATRHAGRLMESAVAGVHFVAADDAASFAFQLDALLTDRDRARAIGAAGRELAERCYSIDALARLLAPATANRR